MAKDFLSNFLTESVSSNDAPNDLPNNSPDNSQSESSNRREGIRLILIGSAEGVRDKIHQMHVYNIAKWVPGVVYYLCPTLMK